MSKKYVIDLKEGLASEKFSNSKPFLDLYASQFSYDHFIGNKSATVCDDKELKRNMKKQKQQRKKLGTGSYGTVDSIVFDKQGKVKFSFKRAKYNRDNKPQDQNSSPNVEVRMAKYLSENFVYPEKCNHFVSYVGHNQCSKFMVLMMEQCDTTIDKLIESRSKNGWTYSFSHNDWDTILFQLVFTLALLHEHNEDYRHNDLKIDNVFINVLQKPKTLYYLWKNKYYSVITKYIVKIGDFGLSCMKGVIDNKDIKQGGFDYVGITQNRHRLYDIFFFLASIEIWYYKNSSKLKARVHTPMMQRLMDNVLYYKNKVKRYSDKMHLLEKENAAQQKQGFPENLVPLFTQYVVSSIPSGTHVYPAVKKQKVKLNFKPRTQKPKLMLQTPIIVKNNVLSEKAKIAFAKSVKEYYARKRAEALSSGFSNLSKSMKRELIKLEKSGTYDMQCPDGKIPNYKVPGRCTSIETKIGQYIMKLHREYRQLLKFEKPLEELFKTA